MSTKRPERSAGDSRQSESYAGYHLKMLPAIVYLTLLAPR